MNKRLLAAIIPGLLLLGMPHASRGVAPAGLLPYDRTNPVWYDNDYSNDYIDWYLMALASAGDIQYKGITTSSSIAPYNQHMPSATYDWCVQDRAGIVQKGRNSGFRNVPNSAAGTKGHLVKPASGRIEDTVPVNSAGIQALLAEARKATAAQPLVVCMGGPVSAAASAYLLDPSIADKMVVVALDMPDGFYSFNGWSDGWAAYITLVRLRLVQLPVHSGFYPRLSKTWIQNNLPNSEAKTHMLSLNLDVVNGSDGDADGMTAVTVRRPDYVQAVKRVSFGGWRIADGHEVPMFKDDPAGRAIVVTQANGTIASQEYERAFKNPAAWSPAPPPPPPSTFPMTLQAETMPTKTAGGWAIPGGWQLWGTGDYVEQTVNFPATGSYRFDITASGMFAGGAWSLMELRIDQQRAAQFTVDSTNWKTFSTTITVAGGARRVAIAFMNDYYVPPSTHRDLNVDKLVISQAGTAPPPPPPPPPPPSGGSGTGLKGDYFDNVDFTNFKLSRTDPAVNFDWQAGSPDGSIAADTFSARWTGQVEAPASGVYTFFVDVDDAVKLWVNGQLIINSSTAYAGEIGASISLSGGVRVALQMEMAEWGGHARAILHWSGPGISKQVIPQSRLYPTSGAPPPPPPPPSSAPGLVAYWRFDETGGASAADASGQGNVGTLRNGPAWWTAGKVGGALRFDGVDDHVTVPNSASLSSPSTQMSMAVWVYRAADKGHWGCVATRQLGAGWDDQYILGFYENTYQFGVHTTAGYPIAAGPQAPNNQWIHMAGTYDGAVVRLYVNGSQVGSAAGSGGLLRDASPLVLGAGRNDASGAASETFNGWIDDVRLYNRALSGTEVQALYNGGAGTSAVK